MKERHSGRRGKPSPVRGSVEDMVYSAVVADELAARRLYPVYLELRHDDGTWVRWTLYGPAELERMRPVFRKMGAMLRVRYKRE